MGVVQLGNVILFYVLIYCDSYYSQDKTIAKRPEVLSVSNYVQNENSDTISEDVKGNRLLLSTPQRPGALLTVPRTPGDIPQVLFFIYRLLEIPETL